MSLFLHLSLKWHATVYYVPLVQIPCLPWWLGVETGGDVWHKYWSLASKLMVKCRPFTILTCRAKLCRGFSENKYSQSFPSQGWPSQTQTWSECFTWSPRWGSRFPMCWSLRCRKDTASTANQERIVGLRWRRRRRRRREDQYRGAHSYGGLLSAQSWANKQCL